MLFEGFIPGTLPATRITSPLPATELTGPEIVRSSAARSTSLPAVVMPPVPTLSLAVLPLAVPALAVISTLPRLITSAVPVSMKPSWVCIFTAPPGVDCTTPASVRSPDPE